MESLAETLNSEEPSSEQDLFQSAKLMSTVSKANPENEEVAKDIVSVSSKRRRLHNEAKYGDIVYVLLYLSQNPANTRS